MGLQVVKILEWANVTARIIAFRIKEIFNAKRLKSFSVLNWAKSIHFYNTRFYKLQVCGSFS